MPRDLTPIEQRPTPYLEAKFDRLTKNQLVADAVECFFILQELGRRKMIAEAMAQKANENHGGLSLVASGGYGSANDLPSGESSPTAPEGAPAVDRTGEPLNIGGPDGAAG